MKRHTYDDVTTGTAPSISTSTTTAGSDALDLDVRDLAERGDRDTEADQDVDRGGGDSGSLGPIRASGITRISAEHLFFKYG